jgi:hypothetical protein
MAMSKTARCFSARHFRWREEHPAILPWPSSLRRGEPAPYAPGSNIGGAFAAGETTD